MLTPIDQALIISSTTLGSIARAKRYHMHMPTPAYKISKAALNMLMVQYSLDYADQGFTFFVVSPGVGLSPGRGISLMLTLNF